MFVNRYVNTAYRGKIMSGESGPAMHNGSYMEP